MVRERGGCRSHAAEEEGRRLRSVGGVAVVVAGRGRVVDGGGGGCVGGGRGVVVNTHERSRQESSSSNGAPSSEAFRSCGTANGGRTGWGSASGGGGKRGARTRTECNFEAQGELVSRCHNG